MSMDAEKQKALQAKLGPFLQELAREVGEAPLVAVIAVHWTTSVSTAASMAPLPKETLFSMISKLSRDLHTHFERLRTALRITRMDAPGPKGGHS